MPECFICGSSQFIDEHHYDNQRGAISPETVPLCRRCHRTYHDWGIGSFSPDTTLKALEVENTSRRILGIPLLREEDIERSSYWYKKHGSARAKKKKRISVSSQLPLFVDI